MCGAPTKPECNRTAKLAFEVDKVSSMFVTFRDSCIFSYVGTLSANQLFGLKVFLFFFRPTGFHSTKVGLLTLETLVVRAIKHAYLLEIIVKGIA